MVDLDFVDILIGFIGFMLPVSIFWAGLYFNKQLKLSIPLSLISAAIIGVILQSPFEEHPHVPGSGVFVIVLVLVFTLTAMLLTLALRYILEKTRNT